MKYKSLFFKGLALVLAGVGAIEAAGGCSIIISLTYLTCALLCVIIDELICINGKFRAE